MEKSDVLNFRNISNKTALVVWNENDIFAVLISTFCFHGINSVV